MTPLDLNTAPLRGDALRTWRHAQDRDDYAPTRSNRQRIYPTQAQVADEIGVDRSTWGHWERHGVEHGPAAAMVRLHMTEGVTFHDARPVTPDEVERLCRLVGGRDALADELSVSVNTVRKWCSRGLGRLHGRLLRHLVDFFGLAEEAA